ncbi:MAG: transcription-repair coupling factor [Armatimonadota bacterium]|nr:transcription-repair coupling factor [Armatimonadota bacterium]MDR7451680.1 transcription-repair coupling factor [Armatimonadota bacterium]MDR7465702.1 transcription-repair coupling factor [Armatimonadota bacterium]MDR7493611.1 transcription-repair coupling factor [Armatimonadota bacterium]MDR7499485.1 transcription-repair coupling factor [Armatimonadota bacterium]
MSLRGLLPPLREEPSYKQALDAVRSGTRPWLVGPTGSEKALVLAALAGDLDLIADGTVLIVTPSREAADRLHDDLLAFLPELEERLIVYPQWEIFTADDGRPPAEAAGERLAVLMRLLERPALWIIAPVAALLRRIPGPDDLLKTSERVAPGQRLDLMRLTAFLASAGYRRVDLVGARGEFAVRGGILDVFPPQAEAPVRVEWCGDEIESVRAFEIESQRSTQMLGQALLPPVAEAGGDASLLTYLTPGALVVYDEPVDLQRQARSLLEGPQAADPPAFFTWDEPPPEGLRAVALSAVHGADRLEVEIPLRFPGVEAFGGQMKLLARSMEEWVVAGRRVVIATAQSRRISEILRDHGLAVTAAAALEAAPEPGQVVAVEAPLSHGFQIETAGLVVVTDSEMVGWRRRRRRQRFREGVRLYSWTDLAPGDYVVHIHHGIGIYRGMRRLLLNGAERDYLELEYAQGDRLFVPTDQINLVQRYIGVEGQRPKVHRLSGAEWEREKRKVREAAREMARELLALYALRESTAGHAFAPDTPWQHELEATFEFEETPDQWLAIQDVKRDMEQPRPMDRLIAGDVGYGKTEVALRAAFKAVMDGKQVAVLVPTTVLAQQHYNVFLKRLAAYPVRVDVVSRFRTRAELKKTLAELAAGTLDIVIGTHRLLEKDVRFKDLGLLIIDEEQRFGVRHKEKLKQLRATVDVLTLTATPIPRTLHMSLAGLRDMSVMETPPEARLPIHTEIRPYDDDLVRWAILRELERGGQVYVVHNRVETIERAARRIRALVPEARVAVAHGQMPEERLEQVMMDFLGGRDNVLVCTTIVEIGLDIPLVNTILIEDAHLMGLSQLYQLRGRVGRADRQAYCYLLYPRGAQLTEEARRRLQAMQEFVELGSGLKLAMRDLEIRGAGNLLGPEQHGHLAAVGFELYARLLDEAVRELRGQIVEETPETTIDLGVDAFLPETYVSDEGQRMALYRKLAAARTVEEAEEVAEEIVDRYGTMPAAAAHLVEIVRLRALAREAGVVAITRERDRITLRPAAGWTPTAEEEPRLTAPFRGRLTVASGMLRLRTEGTNFAEDAEWIRRALSALKGLTRRREPAAVR